MYFCVCICVLVWVWADTHLCVSTCKSQRLTSGVILRNSPPCFFETGSFTELGTHWPDPPVSVLQAPRFLCGCWGQNSSSSCLCGKYFTAWAISLVPVIVVQNWLCSELLQQRLGTYTHENSTSVPELSREARQPCHKQSTTCVWQATWKPGATLWPQGETLISTVMTAGILHHPSRICCPSPNNARGRPYSLRYAEHVVGNTNYSVNEAMHERLHSTKHYLTVLLLMIYWKAPVRIIPSWVMHS